MTHGVNLEPAIGMARVVHLVAADENAVLFLNSTGVGIVSDVTPCPVVPKPQYRNYEAGHEHLAEARNHAEHGSEGSAKQAERRPSEEPEDVAPPVMPTPLVDLAPS